MNSGWCKYPKGMQYQPFRVRLIIVIMFLVVNSCIQTVCCTDNTLYIAGPSEVFEGETVVFTILLNDQPVQAKVIFDTSLSTLSNGSTGEVSITMPVVPFTGKYCEITAWVAGNLSVSKIVYVKNLTGALSVQFSNETIKELETFSITVQANENPVEATQVWFNSEMYLTDTLGSVVLIAPDVLVTTNVGLYVNKSGYGPYSSTIRIAEAGRGDQLYEIIVPSIIEQGEQDIKVYVLGLSGGVAAAHISVWYEGVMVEEQITDEQGRAWIDSPSPITADYFTVQVEKTGYRSLSGIDEVKIYIFEPVEGPTIYLDVTPSEVDEGDTILISIFDDVGRSIDGVSIWLGYENSMMISAVSGSFELHAPVVFFDQERYIYALKEKHNFGSARFTIRNKPGDQNVLNIVYTTVINESSWFALTIVDSFDRPVSDVAVWFNNNLKYSDSSGIVEFQAPPLDKTKMMWINASHSGFSPLSSMIEVVDVDNASGFTSKLIVGVVPTILEGESFIVSVRTMQGIAVPGVRVVFGETVYFTDYTGMVVLIAPEVSWDST
ncbi:MAG: hypothetical protein KKG04_07560, partial [Candidatus Thermoplasmatota archaeon]|nr:hypothetical protein [Candidatus Thermoplasmatota archaeon]